MDYDAHEFHDIIQKNWNENLIPNVILSSATLPKIHELTETVTDFQDKFHGARIYNIVSHDCRKSIPLINKNGFVEMPHYMSDSYDDIIKIAEHCENYLTLLRYFDLKETSRFISYVETLGCVAPKLRILRNFGTIDDIDMKSIKMYYIQLLKGIDPLQWEAIHAYFKSSRIMRVLSNDKIDTKGNKIVKTQSIGPGSTPMTTAPSRSLEGKQIIKQMSDPTPTLSVQPTPTPTPSSNGNCAIYVTTKDAHTLTDGPTIFIVNDIDKIARFCIQQSNIPVGVMNDIMEKISFNNKVNENIRETEKSIEDLMEFSKDTSVDTPKHGVKVEKSGKTKKMDSFDSTNTKNKELRDLSNNLSMLQSMIKLVSLNETFVPNKILHLAKWTDDSKIKNAFTSDIDEETVISIMMLDGVEDSWKILLLLGIGVFTMHKNIAYTEIMKKLADTQKLYMIIASSDYIYGTNYQFCHGYISKDLVLTQEKIIQALGRIGRNNIQHEYSIRFRDDEQIKQLFKTEVHKPEVVNMNRLFNRKI
jgi:hypothetical protein